MNLALPLLTTDPTPAFLSARFGLSPSEALTAAAIAAGRCPKRCALDRGVSVRTIRTQLATIFLKTGTQTQSALTATAWRAWHAFPHQSPSES